MESLGEENEMLFANATDLNSQDPVEVAKSVISTNREICTLKPSINVVM